MSGGGVQECLERMGLFSSASARAETADRWFARQTAAVSSTDVVKITQLLESDSYSNELVSNNKHRIALTTNVCDFIGHVLQNTSYRSEALQRWWPTQFASCVPSDIPYTC